MTSNPPTDSSPLPEDQMPENEMPENGMPENEIDDQRERLLAMRDHMDRLLSQTEEDTQPVELGSSFGRLSRIDAIQMRGMAEMSRRQLEVRRQLVDLALQALEAGKYGRCRQCGGRIGHRRLEALPETPFCIDCQESFEREG